jgi:hypothetical protein
MTRVGLAIWGAAIALSLAGNASAGSLTIGTGSMLDLGTGSLALGCGDLDVTGTLIAGSVGVTGVRDVAIDPSGIVNASSATISLAGDWDNAGTFNAGSSTVEIVDGCSVLSSVVTGNTTFANFAIHTTTAKQVSFTAGSTQSMAYLSLLGAAGNLLQIRSTVNGSLAFLDLTGGSSVDFIDVDDIDAQQGNDIAIGANSVVGPNTPGWLPAVVVPMLGLLALGVLALLLLVSGPRWLPGSMRGDTGL